MEQIRIINTTLDYLLKTPLGNNFEDAAVLLNKFQNFLNELDESDDPGELAKKKVGTILALAVLKKAADGKLPKQFTEEDWKEIADTVGSIAIDMDGKKYSILVFLLYAMWIDQTVESLAGLISENQKKLLQDLSQELKDKSMLLQEGQISEVAYVEDCLWIALEASIKVLSAFISVATGDEVANLMQAAAMVGFEYGRLMLFKKEQKLLSQYIDNQKMLDQELQEQFDSFEQELKKDMEQFNVLIDNAFDADFKNMLRNSVTLARKAGVEEKEILTSMDEIDDFFMA